ncbi:hypothetical protein SAMN04487898_10669 [Pedobacter sp. ok626]|nr:hypothetical protein SAMN04487898_10669 [Pedobacter sp. ok626]
MNSNELIVYLLQIGNSYGLMARTNEQYEYLVRVTLSAYLSK